ncbi:MAG: patatin family protein [Kiritimatiellae bacterium]|nr:patatin family protein [Kiritimatiellia bacterium]
MRRGLVLEGGGMRCLFSAGVMDAWMEAGVVFDGAVGVSAGACFGCNYKSGQAGRAIRYNLRFAKEWRYCGVRSLLLTGDLFGADFCFHRVPRELDPFDAAAYEANPMEFHAVATDADTGEAKYWNIGRVDGEIYEKFRASASMPLVARPVEVAGRRYLDGGLSDAIPLKYFEGLGYGRNVVVTTRERGYRKKAPGRAGLRVARWLLRDMPAVVEALGERWKGYNRTLDYIESREREGAVFVVAPPEAPEIHRVCHDRAQMRRTYETGRATGTATAERVKAFFERNP